ncbi:hypothetical protein HAX54_047211, partial [Datura stramonium]|nr:hypothetical protein [Datura stramonium]
NARSLKYGKILKKQNEALALDLRNAGATLQHTSVTHASARIPGRRMLKVVHLCI